MSKKTVVKTKRTDSSEDVDAVESSDETKPVAGKTSDDSTLSESDFAEKTPDDELTPTFIRPATIVDVAPVVPAVPRKKVGPYGGEIISEEVDGYVWVKLPAFRILKMQAKGECRRLAMTAEGSYAACEVPVSSLVEE